MIRVEAHADLDACCRRAADLVFEHRAAHDHFVLGVATGASTEPLHRLLVAGGLRSQGLHLVLLDEYLGLRAGDPRRFRHEIEHALAAPLGIPAERVLTPPAPDDGSEPTTEALAEFEARLVAWGGVDVQILGIGTNGHVAFDEPGSHPRSRTRAVSLQRSTRLANAAAFAGAGDVPRRAVTQGIATILDSRRAILIASGRTKRAALHGMLHSPPTCWLPASLLTDHADALVLADAAALG